MPATPVYIICSPRPQVGKTLLARLLSEFQLLKNGNVAAFDVNLKEPSLLDYLPKITETADVIDTYGKMQLMDRVIVDDGLAKVIDLGFHAFDEFFKMADEIGLLKEAARRHVAPQILFVADTDREAKALAKRNSMGRCIEYILELTRRASATGVSIWKRDAQMADGDCNLDYFMNEVVIAGDPDSVTAQVLRLRERIGRFATLVLVAHDWDDRSHWNRSLELFAKHVMPAVRL